MMSEAKIILDLSNEDYHSKPDFSSSQIKDMLRTPAHFYAKHISKDAKKSEPTKSMLLGTVVHSLVLESDKFSNEYAISQNFDRRTKKGKAAAAEFEELTAGKTIIDDEMYQQAKAMAENVLKHPVAKLLKLPDMINEASIFYTDSETGLDCRIRPDFHLPPCDAFPNGLIVDLKTTDNAGYFAFNRTIVNFGYHISAAMYCDGFMQLYDTKEPPAFIWLVVERDAPYAPIAYSPDSTTLAKGWDKKSEALIILADCLAKDEWNAYSTDILNIELPKWA